LEKAIVALDEYRTRIQRANTQSYEAYVEDLKRCERRSFAHEEGVPDRILNLFEGGWQETQPVRDATAAIRSGCQLLVLLGPPGSGKSCAAGAILLLPVFEGADGYRFVGTWRHAAEYCQSSRDREKAYLQRRAMGALYLVIDDAGEEGHKDHKLIEQLITRRYDDHRKVTILTTNLSGKEFLSAYGERVSSRLKHVGKSIYCGEKVRPG
jgi:DNA replication protein DnaC